MLEHDPSIPVGDGCFRWKVSRGPKRVGDVAGCLNTIGYRQIQLDGKVYKEHRLIWFYLHGVWPKNEIDHINNQRNDNRIENLREATRSQNSFNTKVRKTNKSTGHKNIQPHGPGYRFICKLNGKTHYPGTYATIEEAIAVRDAWHKKHVGEFAKS